MFNHILKIQTSTERDDIILKMHVFLSLADLEHILTFRVTQYFQGKNRNFQNNIIPSYEGLKLAL